MKRTIKTVMVAIMATACAMCGAACGGGEKNIMVISREDGSGTRSAFEEIVKKDGVKLQDAKLTEDMELASSTGTVVSKVETNKTAIGYVSFASLSDTVKAVSVNGVEATAENVLNGSYEMKRPFILMTSTEYTLSAVAQDFFDYCMSSEAQDEIAAEGCVAADREYAEYTTTVSTLSGEIKVEGSTSMQDLITALIGGYKRVQPNVTVSATYNGSSNGRSAVQNDRTGNTIGLASSAKSNDKYQEHVLCIDAIAVIVHKDSNVEDLSVEQLFDIYTGKIKKFSEIGG